MSTTANKIKVTIYQSGIFGINKTEATLVSIERRDYAQYRNIPAIKFVPKGKRNATGFYITALPYVFVVLGHGHPSTIDGFTPKKDEGAVVTSMSRFTSFDERYKTEFDAVLNQIKANNPEAVLVDYRDTVNVYECKEIAA